MPTQSLTYQLRLLEEEIVRTATNSRLSDAYRCEEFAALFDRLLAVAKGLEKERDELRDLRAGESASIRAALEAAAANADEANALRAENERLRAWLKKAGEDLTKESEAQAAEDLERYQNDPDYH